MESFLGDPRLVVGTTLFRLSTLGNPGRVFNLEGRGQIWMESKG